MLKSCFNILKKGYVTMKKTAIITGASRGVGKETANLLYKKGYNLGLVARNFSKGYCNKIKSRGKQKIVIFRCDLSVQKCVLDFCKSVKKEFRVIDVIINNAGFNTQKTEIENFGIEEYNKLIDVNMKAPFFIINELLPSMKKRRKGHIINVVSTIARDFRANWGPYASAKAGLLAFSNVLSRECARSDIKVTSFLPGGINTGFRPKKRPNYMSAKSVAEIIAQVLEVPYDVVMDEVVIKPISEIKAK